MAPGKPKLLIVDDEIDICTFTQSYFGKRGFNVSTTGNGVEALIIIETSHPDIVLLDLKLESSMSGVDVLKTLRENDKNTKVIVISGNTDESLIDSLYDIGITAFYPKPMILAEIAQKIYEELGIEYDKDGGGQVLTRTALTSDGPVSASIHQLSNKLNIIRGDCEEFLLDYEEGFFRYKTQKELLQVTVEIVRKVERNIEGFLTGYSEGDLKLKTTEELLKMNVQILKNIVQAVDDTMGIINKNEIKESNKKEVL